jgi:hypothetical protein
LHCSFKYISVIIVPTDSIFSLSALQGEPQAVMTMRFPIRIAVLECDTPLPQTKRKYVGYGGCFDALLRASAKTLAGRDRFDPDKDLQISRWDVVDGEEYPNLGDIDAILITGSSIYLFFLIVSMCAYHT